MLVDMIEDLLGLFKRNPEFQPYLNPTFYIVNWPTNIQWGCTSRKRRMPNRMHDTFTE